MNAGTSEKSYGEMMDDVFQTIREQADRIEALEAALRKADIACFNLCVNHGFATGHGDTVAAMIEEIDAQISISDRRSVIELIHRIEALEAALRSMDEVAGGSLDEPDEDEDWKVIVKMRAIARAALARVP